MMYVMLCLQTVPTPASLSPFNICSTVCYSLSHAPSFAACGCPGKEHLLTPWMQLETTAVPSVAFQDQKALQFRGSHFTEAGLLPGTSFAFGQGNFKHWSIEPKLLRLTTDTVLLGVLARSLPAFPISQRTHRWGVYDRKQSLKRNSGVCPDIGEGI